MSTNKILLAVMAVVVTAIYFFWNPSEITFLPICLFKNLTGFLCPGCGGQRAFHQILHGNFVEAYHSNLLIYLFVPFFVLKILDTLINTTFSKYFLLQDKGIWIFLGLMIIFTIFRNLPL